MMGKENLANALHSENRRRREHAKGNDDGGQRLGFTMSVGVGDIRRTGGKDAKRLEKIATSTRYGAPAETAPAASSKIVKVKSTKAKVHRQSRTELPRAVRHPDRTRVSALSGFGGVVSDGSDSRLIALLAVMALTAVAAAVLAIVRRRSPR